LPKRMILSAIAAVALLVAVPVGAEASSKQISIFEDSSVFFGQHPDKDLDAALAQAKALGADAVRASMTWSRTSPAGKKRVKPAGFDVANPNSPGYDWSLYDRFVDRARKHGLKVFLSLSGEIPYWASNEPSKCPHHIGGYKNLALSCMWKPNSKLYGQFVKAVAAHYRGKVAMYSMWNEPNLEHQLYPQFKKTRSGMVDLGGKQLRELWIAGYKGAVSADKGLKNKVLFGETAAISSPMDTLYSALCLTEEGKPYTGRMKALQGCSKPAKLPIAGLAIHPYNKDGVGNVFTRSFTKDSMTMAYASRATRVLRAAEKYKRIPKGRGIYVTEFGFQTKPPDRRGLSLDNQAKELNQADRLFFADPRIRSVAQFELFDAKEPKKEDVYNTGLLSFTGKAKPSLAAYRMPLVVTNLAADRVEVWGQVRPARGRVTPVVAVSKSSRGPFVRASGARTNASGYYRFVFKRANAAKLRYRATWTSPSRQRFTSRVATAGKAITYREKP